MKTEEEFKYALTAIAEEAQHSGYSFAGVLTFDSGTRAIHVYNGEAIHIVGGLDFVKAQVLDRVLKAVK